jgi:hypothetical protein
LWLALLFMNTAGESHWISLCLECSDTRIRRQNRARAIGCVVFLAVLVAIGIIALVVLSSHR